MDKSLASVALVVSSPPGRHNPCRSSSKNLHIRNLVPERIDLLGTTEETLALFSSKTSGKICHHQDVEDRERISPKYTLLGVPDET